VKPARLAVIALWLLGLAACSAWLARNLSVDAELTVFLPPSTTPAQRLLVEQLRDGVASRLILVAIGDGSALELAGASKELARRLRQSGLFSFVNNGDPTAFSREREILSANRYLLSPAVDAKRFSTAALQAAIEENLELLASPAGPFVRHTLAADPTGELRQLAGLIAPQDGPSLQHGVWFTRDASRALLVAETRAAGFDVDAQKRAIAFMREAFAAALPGTGRLELSGPGVFASQMRDTIHAESWRLSLLASVLVILILTIAFRSFALVAACALPVVTGLLVGVTAVAMGFGTVHGITLAFGATLIGEAVDYPSYLFANAAPGEPLDATLSRMGHTLRLAVLTTLLGASAMAFSSFEGLAQLGMLTIAGVLAAGLTTTWVLPRLVAPRATERKLVAMNVPSLLPRLLKFVRWPAVALAAAALVFVVSRQERIWDDDLANLSPISESAKSLDRRLRNELGAPDVRYLVLARANDREAALERSESLAGWLGRAVAGGRIAGFEVPSAYLPSRRTQESRRSALPEVKTLAESLSAALKDSNFRQDAFAPFLESVARARSGPLLDTESLSGSLLGLKVSALLVENRDGWTAVAPLRGVQMPERLAAEAARADYEFLDLKEESNRLVNAYRNESLKFFALGLLGIAVFLALSLRSLARAARVLLPVLAAAVLDVALLLLMGRTLSLFNLVALLLVVGVGLNYALFFERPQEGVAERVRTRLSVTVCATTTLSVFGCLMLSQTPVLRSIGETVFFGCLLSVLFCAALSSPYARGRA